MLFALCLGYASTHFIDVLCLCNHFSPDITPYSVDLSILAIGYQRHHSTQYHGTIHTDCTVHKAGSQYMFYHYTPHVLYLII